MAKITSFSLLEEQEEAIRNLQKLDAEKSRGLLGGLSGLGTPLPASLTKEEYEKARKLAEMYSKSATRTASVLKESLDPIDPREKYRSIPEYKNGIKALEKAAADFCLKNDIDMDTLLVMDYVNVEHSTITNCDILQLRYKLEYAGKYGIETHILHYTTKIL